MSAYIRIADWGQGGSPSSITAYTPDLNYNSSLPHWPVRSWEDHLIYLNHHVLIKK